MKKLYAVLSVFAIAIQISAQGLDFTATPTSGCPSLVVTFTNTSTNPAAYRFEWNFQDGSPILVDTLPTTVTHTFTSAGNYCVNVNVWNSSGSYVGSTSGSSGCIQPTGASFWTPDSLCAGDEEFFCYNNQANSVFWDFGDGNNSTQQCTSHSWSANGTYTVTLIVNTSCGYDTATKTIKITPNAFPNMNWWTNPNSPFCPTQQVTFNTNATATYSWSFGDGGTSTQQQPSYSYTATGTYTVTLIKTNNCGKTDTSYNTVTVSSTAPFPNQSWFKIDVMSSPSCPNTNVNFNVPPGYNSYEWNYGDGSPLYNTANNYANHIYGSTLTTYTASVRITNACGNDTTMYAAVQITSNAPFPNQSWFQVTSTSPGCPNGRVDFEAPSDYFNYEWNFGDGSPLINTSDRNAFHFYGPALTTYTVSVKITNGCGNDSTLYTTVTIQNNVGFPSQNFSLEAVTNPGCIGNMQYFTSPQGYASYLWSFGDGDSALTTQEWAGHNYSSTGTYTVSVLITNYCGNDTTLYISLVVDNTGSIPNFLQIEVEPIASACSNDMLQFRINAGVFSSYQWDFGDGNSAQSTGDQIMHSYTTTGTYTVSCIITNGCGISDTLYTSVQITTSAPVANVSLAVPYNPACPGDEVLFPIGGLSSYTYIWDYGDGSAADTTNGTSSHTYTATGTYTVSVVATNGCGNTTTVTATVNITNSAYPVFYAQNGDRLWGVPGGEEETNANVGCPGDAIVFYFFGSNPNNVFNFGDGFSATATEQMVVYGGDGGIIPVTFAKHAYSAAGTYSVTLTLTNNCNNSATDTMLITIGNNSLVNGSLETSPPPYATCNEIDFIAFGGSTYTWDFGDGFPVFSTSSPTASHTYSSAGIYVASVFVTNGCGNSATYTRSIEINSIGGPSVSLNSSSNPTCYGGSDGNASVLVTSGQSPFAYLWSDANMQTSPSATGLPAGIYHVTVTDDIGCSSTFSITINNPAPIVLSDTSTLATCGQQDGTATVNVVSGGTGPFTYQWSSGGNAATEDSLGWGNYSVLVTDANGCTSSANASVSENGAAAVSLNSVTDAICNATATGSIDINVTGGNPPYTYSWSTGATTQDVSNMAAGTYSVIVMDASGCKSVLSASVSEPIAIVVSTSVVQAPTCSNFDGQASASPENGNPPYTYLWTNAGNQTTQTATGLPAGSYSVTVTDADGCTDVGVISLSNSNAPTVISVVTNVSCFGDGDGSIDLTVSGGTSPYLYTWNVPPPQTNYQDINNLAPGNYIVSIQDASGCFSVGSYNITQPVVLTVSVSVNGATCGNSDGTATATGTGGTGSYTYLWTPSSQTTQTAGGLSLGNYSVTITDANGCTATGTVTVSNAIPEVPTCLVTVDSASVYNNIVWEKAPFAYANIDTFFIYREITTNNYQPIGAVPFDSLSLFVDTVRTLYFPNTGDPNSGTYRYKIMARDSCGTYSATMSPYHNTIYIIHNGSGNFSWNLYDIENASNPVTSYVLLRDDNSTGIWQAVASVAGTQQTVTDPNYSSYPNGSWRVETQWGIVCNPSIKNPKDPSVMGVNKSISNTYKTGTVTVNENFSGDGVIIFPNPGSGTFTVFTGSIKITRMEIRDILGREVVTSFTSNNGKHTFSLSGAKGVYFLKIVSDSGMITRKIVIE